MAFGAARCSGRVRVGKRSVRYPLAGVFDWADRRSIELDWREVALSVALPAFAA